MNNLTFTCNILSVFFWNSSLNVTVIIVPLCRESEQWDLMLSKAYWNILRGCICIVFSKWLVLACSLSPWKHMLSCPVSISDIWISSAQKQVCVSTLQSSRTSSVFRAHKIFATITITLLSPYLYPRATQMRTRRMWTASNFSFWKAVNIGS